MRYSMKASTPLAVTEQMMSGTSSPAAHTVVDCSSTGASMANSRVSILTQCYGEQLPGSFDKSCSQLQQRVMISPGWAQMSAYRAWPTDPLQCLPTGASPFAPWLSLCNLQNKETGVRVHPYSCGIHLLQMSSSCLTLLNDHPVLTVRTLCPALQAGGHDLPERRKCRFRTVTIRCITATEGCLGAIVAEQS